MTKVTTLAALLILKQMNTWESIMSKHNLIEPIPKNFEKEDYWGLWCMFCDNIALKMEPSPARDRVESYSLFSDNQIPHNLKYSLGDSGLETKYGTLISAQFISYYWDFKFKCGDLSYEVDIDFTKIADYFPAEVLSKRYLECPPEKDTIVKLYWESGPACYTRYVCEYSFFPIKRKLSRVFMNDYVKTGLILVGLLSVSVFVIGGVANLIANLSH